VAHDNHASWRAVDHEVEIYLPRGARPIVMSRSKKCGSHTPVTPPHEVAQLSIARKTMKLSLEQSDED
jgi:hypothetical protein